MRPVALLSVLLATLALQAADDGLIEGTVVKASGEPVMRAIVSLQPRNASSNLAKPVTTDMAGKFSFPHLGAGRYVIHVERQGFMPLFYGQMKSILVLTAGQQLKDLRLTLQVGGVITGRVSDDYDEPVANANMALFRVQYNRNGKQLLQVGNAKSDDRGEYRIFDVPHGRYLLQSTANLMTPVPGKPGALRYISTVFYPGTMDPKQASWLEIVPGTEQRGLDFRMRPVPTVSVRGVLRSANGKPSAGYLRMQPAEGYAGLSVGSITANAREDGNFEFPAVIPGRYLLLGDQAGNGSVRLSAKMPLQVGSGDLENVVVVTQPSMRVTGTLRVEKGGAKSVESVAVGLQANDNGMRGAGGGARATADGTFVMENVVPDSYDLMIYGLEPDGYVKTMRAGNIDLFERELVLGGEGINLEVEIAANGGKIEGDVTRSAGAAVSGAQVVLMPTSGRNWMILSKQTVADESGHFLLRGVAPGSYELYSWAEIENGRWWDAEFLASVKNRAIPLKVEGTATAAVKLTIIE